MTRSARRLVIVAVLVLVAVGAGVGARLLTRDKPPRLPEISVSTPGHSAQVGPYLYCKVLDLNDCQTPRTEGELPVTDRDPVRLAVPNEIGRAPWRLLEVYGDERNSTQTMYRPNTQSAVTIPTADPQRGRLTGIAVQLLTLVRDSAGQLHDVPHAEWSVRMLWR